MVVIHITNEAIIIISMPQSAALIQQTVDHIGCRAFPLLDDFRQGMVFFERNHHMDVIRHDAQFKKFVFDVVVFFELLLHDYGTFFFAENR